MPSYYFAGSEIDKVMTSAANSWLMLTPVPVPALAVVSLSYFVSLGKATPLLSQLVTKERLRSTGSKEPVGEIPKHEIRKDLVVMKDLNVKYHDRHVRRTYFFSKRKYRFYLPSYQKGSQKY